MTKRNLASINFRTFQAGWEEASSAVYDVIVVGAGVTGAGTALDAASRGLKTLLIERYDIGAGTSRWSSKLIHGGLRYLASGQFGIAYESAQERHYILQNIAPHLSRPEAFIVPLDANTGPIMGIIGEVGIRLGDAFKILAGTPSAVLPLPRRISATEVLHYAPCINPDGLRGGVLYWDGQLEDDARFTIALARTAKAFGARVLTGAAATRLTEHTVDVTRVSASGEAEGTLTLRAKAVINATGVWAEDLDDRVKISPSRGSHLVVPAAKLGNPTCVFTSPVPGHFGRYIMGLPAPDGLVYLGLTDEPADGADPLAPECPPEDQEFIMGVINRALRVELTPEDIVGSFAGLRPLLTSKHAGSGGTADISRRHLLLDSPGQPLTIAGGKLTTYRKMAEDAVDAACARLGVAASCRTRKLPLIGAAPRRRLLDVPAPTRLVHRYGTEAMRVMQLAEAYPQLAQPVCPDSQVIGAELLFGALHEGARSVDDLLQRRTRLSMVPQRAKAATPSAQAALDLAAEILA